MNVKISKQELQDIVQRVMTYFLKKRDTPEQGNPRTLILVPKYAVKLQDMIAEYELYGALDTVDFLLETPLPEFETVSSGCVFFGENKDDVSHILGKISEYQKVEIYDPSLEFLKALKDGKENCLFTRIAIYFLMTNKPTVVRLPYDKDNVPSGRFGKETRDLMDALWDMGVSFADLIPNFDEFMGSEFEQQYDLITEELVEECFRRGYKEIYAGRSAVVTPLATERAKELEIQIIKG